MLASISEVVFGKRENGQTIKKYRLKNAAGAEATFLNLGAAWVGFKFNKDEPNLVLGCDNAPAFLAQQANLGATVGRFANRIAGGRFELDGHLYQLDQNLGEHCLHGGNSNLTQKVWQSNIVLADDKTPTLTFVCESPDGESGFPGNVQFKVVISLTENNEVRFEYSATTDKKTVINITNHAYFNLDGATHGHLNNHVFKIASDQYLPADNTGLPTGELKSVSNTLMDLRHWTNVSPHLESLTDATLEIASGYDHCYTFPADGTLKLMASAKSTRSNRQVDCWSNLPGMQFYSGNFLGGTRINETKFYQTHGAFCFEPGYWPNSPNQSHFPNCIIDVEHPFNATMSFKFT